MWKLHFLWVYVLLFLPISVWAKPDRIVLGYSASWRDVENPPSEYNWDGLNFLARSFLHPTPDGSIAAPDGYFNSALKKSAHQHAVKLLMSIGGGGASSKVWLSIANNPKNLQRFVSRVYELIASNDYDGVDIDWEPADPTLTEWQSYVVMLKALRLQLPHAVITTALPTDEYSTRFLPWPEVISTVDFINAMAYDYSGPWGGIAGHATNLFPAGDYSGELGHSVQEGMQNLIKNHNVPPDKLLLGMNFWAYRFRVNHIGDHFKANAAGISDDLSYQQILNLQASGLYKSLWDEKAQNPYLERIGGGSVISFENPDSIRRKCDYAKSLGCAGMMIWGLGGDECGTHTPLMDSIMQSCGGQKRPLSRAALESTINNFRVKESPNVPLALSTLRPDQLESLNETLQRQEGYDNDRRWQAGSVAH